MRMNALCIGGPRHGEQVARADLSYRLAGVLPEPEESRLRVVWYVLRAAWVQQERHWFYVLEGMEDAVAWQQVVHLLREAAAENHSE